MASQMLHVRMDEGLKADGAALFHSMGMTESEGVRMLYKRALLNQPTKIPSNASDPVKKTGRWSDFDGLLPSLHELR